MNIRKLALLTATTILTVPAIAMAGGLISTPPGKGPYNGPPGFDRGMNTTMHCGNNPESWVRGSTTLDPSTGAVAMTVQLETDSTRAGPKGILSVTVKDSQGNALATLKSNEVGMGGKPPGHAVIRNFTANANVPMTVASKAASLDAAVQCTGSVTQLWGIDSGSAIHAVSVAVTAIGATQ
ncbi:hypothetical protein [Paraburkholderia youngii]|uniref:hypothetical protein n=1 Tax=Paraburkholderia youngii TaxID=2782701 RepID=UPI003D22130B